MDFEKQQQLFAELVYLQVKALKLQQFIKPRGGDPTSIFVILHATKVDYRQIM
jgi:hypothetical protein